MKDEGNNQNSLTNDDVESIIANAAEAVVEIFEDVREIAGMAADVGCLACTANGAKPKGIYNTLTHLRAWARARKLHADVFNASEIISDRAEEASDRLRKISHTLDQASLHASDRRTQYGIEQTSRCVSRLLSSTAQMRFFKLIVNDWQVPNINEVFQSGLEEYDREQH